MALDVTERTAVIEGVKHNYAEGGPPDAPALLLLPGQSFSWHSYQKVLPSLIQRFHVFALDLRGHGKSEHTPGRYTFSLVGKDVTSFLEQVVKAPAIVGGNSSGGIFAIWAAANRPELVRAVLAEDPPLFTTEFPRAHQTWVHGFFKMTIETLPDLERYFSSLRVPTQGSKKLITFPAWLAKLLGGAIRRYRKAHPGQPVDLWWLPLQVRLFVRGLSEYDVDFTRACFDGRMYDFDHAAALARVKCPMLLVQAASFVHPELGLVGAMADEDVARAKQLLPGLLVEQLNAQHVVHIAKPKLYVTWVDRLQQAASAGAAR